MKKVIGAVAGILLWSDEMCNRYDRAKIKVKAAWSKYIQLLRLR